MNVVFAHDHKFRFIDGRYYSTGGLSDEALSRYTDMFGDVNILSRVVPEQNGDRLLTEIKNPNVKITAASFGIREKAVDESIKVCDAVIARLPSFLGNTALDCAKKYNKPFLIEVVGCPWDALWNHSIKGKAAAPWFYFTTRQHVENAAFVSYVTNQFLQSRYPTRGEQTSCSNVALTEFDDGVLINRFKSIRSKPEKIIIGTIGAVNVRHKGQQHVIRALGELKRRGITNYEYQLVGSGSQSYLKKIAEKCGVSDQIEFLGSLPHDQVFKWLDTIDIYAQPSLQEGLPRALIEAMSRGLPAFGANTGGIPELLESEYIFSNTKDNLSEICNILLNFDEASMHNSAIRNLQEAKKYDRNLIEQRRNAFFQKFKESVELGYDTGITYFAQYGSRRGRDLSYESLPEHRQGTGAI